MNEQQQDKEFEAFLAGKSKLKRPYKRIGSEQPPAEVDQRILAEARQVAKSRREELGPRGGWLKPAALAATVLLSFSVVMKIGVDWPADHDPDLPVTVRAPAAGNTEPSFAEELRAPAGLSALEKPVPEKKEMPGRVQTFGRVVDETPEVFTDLPSKAVDARSAAAKIDRDFALAVVSKYLAAIDTGRAEADAPDNRLLRQSSRLPAEALSGAMSDSPTATASGDEQAEEAETGQAERTGTETIEAELLLPDDAELMLREIIRLDAEQRRTEADRLLGEFVTRYPGHPVSVKLGPEAKQP